MSLSEVIILPRYVQSRFDMLDPTTDLTLSIKNSDGSLDWIIVLGFNESLHNKVKIKKCIFIYLYRMNSLLVRDVGFLQNLSSSLKRKIESFIAS